MQEVYKAIGRVAAAGRDRADPRRERHRQGAGRPRHLPAQPAGPTGPFLAINCAAIPETLLESELFGHEKGAFTGADRKRIGKFEQCHGGTLFLDEIGDMTPLTQAKLLRVLQEQRFERVGGNETIQTDVRIIAATNRDLEQLVAAGRFRADLYYRLNVFTIRLPPLRERGDDLPLLVEHFLRRFSRELGKDVRGVAPEALDVLRRYPWPGNVRELQSVLKQALLQATGPVLLPEFLPPPLHRGARRGPRGGREARPATADRGSSSTSRLAGRERGLYAEARRGGWSGAADAGAAAHRRQPVQAARILGITRGSLRTKLRAWASHRAHQRRRRGGADLGPRARAWPTADGTVAAGAVARRPAWTRASACPPGQPTTAHHIRGEAGPVCRSPAGLRRRCRSHS